MYLISRLKVEYFLISLRISRKVTIFQDVLRMLREKRLRLVVRVGVDDRTPGLDVGRVLDQKFGFQPTQAFHEFGSRLSVAAESVGYHVHDRFLPFQRADGTDGVPAHGDRLVELPSAERTQHMQAHAYGAGTVAVDDDVVGRAVEVLDVPLYPVKGGDLIEHAVIAGRLGVRRREESEDV